MTLYLYLRVKFRLFGFTIGTLEKIIDLNVNIINRSIQVELTDGIPPAHAQVLMNERGVYLVSWL